MSLRPPSKYWIVVTGTGGSASSDPTNFTLAASGLTKVPESLGANLVLQGIVFEAGADGKNFVATPGQLPAGSAVTTVTQVISAPSFLPEIPASIDGSTTAFPFELHYGALGPGAR